MVHEIREEIEHAVEHVPQPVRWTVRKLFLIATGSLLLLVLLVLGTAALYVANRTEWVARELTLFLNGTLAQKSDVAIDIADIRGNPLRGVELLHPRARFRDGNHPPLLVAERMRVSYSPWRFLTRDRFVDIVVESPEIRLANGTDGRLRLPTWKSAGPSPPRQGEGGLEVRVRFRNGRVTGPAPIRSVEDLNLEARISVGRATGVELRELSWASGPFATKNLRLSGRLTAGDSVRFEVRRLRTADLAMTARGGWRKGEPERWIRADVQRLRWRWLADAVDNRTFDVPGTGRLALTARGDRAWSGSFGAQLDWGGLLGRASGRFAWAEDRLRLDPLTSSSAAGELEGTLEWSKQGWEIAGTARAGDPSRWRAIGIVGWPEGRLNGQFRYAVDSRDRPMARLDARLQDSEVLGWRADAAEIEVDFPPVGPDSFWVRMFRRGGTAILVGRSHEEGWEGRFSAARFPLEEWPEGRAGGIRGMLTRGEGTVVGREGDLHVAGTLEGEATDWLGARFASWRLLELSGRLLPQPDLTAHVELSDLLFLGVHFDRAASPLHLEEQAASFQAIEAFAGDTVFTAAGRTRWGDSGWSLALDRAAMRSDQFAWVADPPLELSGDPEGVRFQRLVARDGPAALEITGRWATAEGIYKWEARAHGLDLARLGMPEEWNLTGFTDALLEVEGPFEHPRWSLTAACSAPGWQGHRADSVSLSLEGSPGKLSVLQGLYLLDGGAVRASGGFDDTDRPGPDSLTATAVLRWLATAARWEGEVATDGFPLERLEALAPAAGGWSGRLSGTLAISGSPASPVLTARAEARPLAWQEYLVDHLAVRLSYRDQRLEVPELRIERKNLVSNASGYLPLHLEFGVPPQILEREMSWRLDAPRGDLAVLPLFVQQIGSASGRFELSGRIRGTPRHPDLEGFLRIRDGRLRLAGREEVLESVYADCRLDESRVTLDSLTARQGARGRLAGRGTLEVSGAGIQGYRFALTMREFTAVEADLYVAQFDGDFAVTDGPRVDGQLLPLVEGIVEIRRAVVLFDFANQSEVQRIAASTQPLFWTYRVQVNATNNLHWQPPDGEIEFSANLRVEQTLDELTMDGDLDALRGTYYFLSNRFTVQKADLTFRNIDGTDPELDVQAAARVESAGDASYVLGPRPEPHTVSVRITGKSSEPVIEFASEPPDWDEAQILRELTVGRFYAGRGGVSLEDPLDNYLTRAINRTLSAEMSRAFHGYINEWQLERERGGLWVGEGDVILGVGSQVTPNLLLRYRQRVPGLARERSSASRIANPFERDFEAEYRLSRFFYVTSELTQRRSLSGGTSTVSGAPEFNVNLKARWEY